MHLFRNVHSTRFCFGARSCPVAFIVLVCGGWITAQHTHKLEPFWIPWLWWVGACNVQSLPIAIHTLQSTWRGVWNIGLMDLFLRGLQPLFDGDMVIKPIAESNTDMCKIVCGWQRVVWPGPRFSFFFIVKVNIVCMFGACEESSNSVQLEENKSKEHVGMG